MIKHFKFYLLHRLIKDPIVSAQVYHMIYHRGAPPKKEVSALASIGFSPELKSIPTQPKFVPKSEVEELKEQLGYLKSKTLKTKQDKESIGIIEAVLKNKS